MSKSHPPSESSGRDGRLPAEPPALSALRVRSKVWIEAGGETVLCDFWAAILDAVDRTGSFAEAARELSAPQDVVRQRLRESEERLGVPLVEDVWEGERARCELTPEARGLLDRYRRFSLGIREFVDRRFDEEFG